MWIIVEIIRQQLKNNTEWTHKVHSSGSSIKVPPRTNTNPGMLNFRDLGYKELNNAVPPKVQSISMEETVEKSDPKKKRKQQINPYITAMRDLS